MKLPKNAKKMFHGKIFDTYQWPQKMYDGSYETFECIYRRPTVDIIATVNDKIIVLLQRQPNRPSFPSLPAGNIEKNETASQTAKRELLEETGYVAKKMIKFKHFTGSPKIIYPQTIFIAKECKLIHHQKLDAGEKIKIDFKNFDDFLQLCHHERFTTALGLKFIMYEALLDKQKYLALKRAVFGK